MADEVVVRWCGQKLEDMSKEQLIEAMKMLGRLWERERDEAYELRKRVFEQYVEVKWMPTLGGASLKTPPIDNPSKSAP